MPSSRIGSERRIDFQSVRFALNLHPIAAFRSFGFERARHLIAIGHPLSARKAQALPMQPQKDITDVDAGVYRLRRE